MLNRHLIAISISPCLIAGSVLAQATGATSKPARTPVFEVSKPSLISSIVLAQADVDSSDEVSEALSDYQYYLSRAIPVLKQHGVEIYVSNDSTVRWRDSLGLHSMSAVDSGGVLYLFVSPNGQKRTLRQGVEVDEALLDAARNQFGLSIPVSEEKHDDP
jgi:hypothetical protein